MRSTQNKFLSPPTIVSFTFSEILSTKCTKNSRAERLTFGDFWSFRSTVAVTVNSLDLLLQLLVVIVKIIDDQVFVLLSCQSDRVAPEACGLGPCYQCAACPHHQSLGVSFLWIVTEQSISGGELQILA